MLLSLVPTHVLIIKVQNKNCTLWIYLIQNVYFKLRTASAKQSEIKWNVVLIHGRLQGKEYKFWKFKLWSSGLCHPAGGYQSFKGTYCLPSSGLKVEAICSSKTLVHTPWYHNPKKSIWNIFLSVYKLTYTKKRCKMEFDYAGVCVDRIQDSHLLLMHDASVWCDCPQSEMIRQQSKMDKR